MKTGEVLIKIFKNDIPALVNTRLNIAHNGLSPFAKLFDTVQVPVTDDAALDAIAMNQDAVSCLRVACAPLSVGHIGIAGNGQQAGEIFICIAADTTCVIVYSYDDGSYGLQSISGADELSELISSILVNPDKFNTGLTFPDSMNFESFIMLANTIDAYKYVVYRDALARKEESLLKLTSDEFNELFRGSMMKPDFKWLVSSLFYLLPSLAGFGFSGDPVHMNALFDNGFLLSVKDKTTGEKFILLNIAAVDAGIEFTNSWYRSAGVEISTIKDNVVTTLPAAFVTSTGPSDYFFAFDSLTRTISFIASDKTSLQESIKKLVLTNILPKQEMHEVEALKNANFCPHCGNRTMPKAKFCVKCGKNL